MSIKDLKENKRFLLQPTDKYEDNLMEVKIVTITSKAVKWERTDRDLTEKSFIWVLGKDFSKNYTVIEELED